MYLFTHRFDAPAGNLACDEALLDLAEELHSAHPGTAFLRFWESSSYFVVLGYSKQVAREVFEERCEDLEIPILRRSSGGGTVLQGPGCLNYSVILPISAAPELSHITSTNCYVMQQTRRAVVQVLGRDVQIKGYTDLTLEGRKFSGNAQRRKRSHLLFHGSFLLNFDLPRISETLRLPADQPEYRRQRSHSEFLTNLPLAREALEKSLGDQWLAENPVPKDLADEAVERTRALAAEKYEKAEWNRRF